MNLASNFAPLLDLLVKSAALILLGAALLATLRKSSAANRHAVSAAIFAALLLMPLTRLMPARWSFALENASAPAVKVRLPLIATVRADAPASPRPVENIAPPVPHTPLVSAWKMLAVAVWLCGAALLLARRALIALRLRTIVRGSLPLVDARLAAQACALMETSGVRAEVRESSKCRVPLASGIVRPVVLLPAGAAEWSDAYISSALQHELGHIRRRDCLARLLADLVCALYWVNPLVWLAARQMRLAQEQACDDLVLNSGARADEYAGQLVEAVRALQGDRFTARHALAMAQPSTLETRVRAIVDETCDRSARSVRGAAAGIAFTAAALALCAAAQLRGAEEKPAAPPGVAGPIGPSVIIKTKFIEFTGPEDALPILLKRLDGDPAPVLRGILAGAQAEAALKSLGETKGVDVLSAPQVLTRSKQRTMIEITREFRHATEWSKETATGAWKPSIYATKNLGVTFDVTPEVNADGTILLRMKPAVAEFAGFADLDGNAGKVFGKPDAAKRFGERVTAGADGIGIPEGHRAHALFNTRMISTDVIVKPGDTIVLGGMDAADGKEPLRRLFVLVSAEIAGPGGVPIPAEGLEKNRIAPAKAAGGETTVVTSDEATFDKKTGKLQAKGNVKVETPESVITAEKLELQPKKNGGQFAEPKMILPKVEFRNASVQECVDFLVQKSKTLDPQGKGINVVLRNRGGIAGAKITLSLAEIPIAEALRYVAALADCEMTREEFAFIIAPKETPPPAAVSAPQPAAGPRRATNEAIAAEAAPARREGAALKRAGAILLPKVELKDATLRETIDFLRAKAKELDPDKQGVNLILKADSGADTAKITLSLANVPLSEALRYVAALAGCEVTADDLAITIRRALENPSSDGK